MRNERGIKPTLVCIKYRVVAITCDISLLHISTLCFNKHPLHIQYKFLTMGWLGYNGTASVDLENYRSLFIM